MTLLMGTYLKIGSAMAERKLQYPITFLLCGITLYTLVVFLPTILKVKTLIFYLTRCSYTCSRIDMGYFL